MVFQGHHAAGAGLDRRADRIEINAIDERIVDDGGFDVLFREFFPGFDGFANQRTAGDQRDGVAWLQHLRFAPFVTGILQPMQRIIFASDKENVSLAVPAARAFRRVTLDGLKHERFSFVRAGRRNDHRVRYRARGREISRGLVRRPVGRVLKADVR